MKRIDKLFWIGVWLLFLWLMFVTLTGCYKEYCYECFMDLYTNEEAVRRSIEKNEVSGIYSWSLGENPYRLDSTYQFNLCDPFQVENFENGSGVFGTDSVSVKVIGGEIMMDYKTYKINECFIRSQ